MQLGRCILGRRHVYPGVTSALTQLLVEGTFVTGTHLVTVYDPICTEDGNITMALYASFLPIPSADLFPLPDPSEYAMEKKEGTVLPAEGRIVINQGKKRIRLRVVNRGDRPVNVGTSRLH